MENKQSFRNPFPWIWKVFKYEMKNSVRILLPLYLTTVFVALICRMLFLDGFEGLDSAFDNISGIFVIIYSVVLVTSGVVSAAVLIRRFKAGILGDEAYLNFMLPVTVGEHLWGRVLSIVAWIPVCLLSGFFSLTIVGVVRKSDYEFKNWLLLASIFITIVLFAYLVNALGHLAKKHRTIAKIVAVTVILSATLRILVSVFESVRHIDSYLGKYDAYVVSLTLLVFSAIYGVVTYFILKHKLNLE